jgi:hypothetical protein
MTLKSVCIPVIAAAVVFVGGTYSYRHQWDLPLGSAFWVVVAAIVTYGLRYGWKTKS